MLKKTIKKGLTNSIGWNLGNKYKSIHLFEPLTSTPIIGTKNKVTKESKNITKEIFIRFSWSINENMNINTTPSAINIKCFKKKE